MQSEWVKFFDGACPPLGRLRRRVWAASQQREIRWVLADGVGNIREEDWASSQHSGRSAILLRSKLPVGIDVQTRSMNSKKDDNKSKCRTP